MSAIFPGRYTAQIDGPFVLFLIGMRVNRLHRVDRWLPVFRAMRPMLTELYANPQLGLLHAHTALTWRGVFLVQYWRSFDQLVNFAHARDAAHLPAWAAFNRSIGADGTVGVWHETYQVAAGAYEGITVNMPRWGLQVAGQHLPATGRLQGARGRMGQSAEPSQP
ncbi:MAG: DUF4188 domain-containing protein [Acidobacteriota bacterium]|nr:DUF4188 domain-containing protein [Acidobacteriota bacterium]